MTKAERLEKMKQDLIRMSRLEKELYENGNERGLVNYVAGVDEVGRGPLAGPVVAAAVILPKDFDVLGVNDSKKISEKRREELYGIIMEKAVACSISLRDNTVIDRINILEATKDAMREAIGSLSVRPDHIFIDALTLPEIDIPQSGIIKGDGESVSIAAASIVAKVTRDQMMVKYHEIYPDYAFDSNKGYGTKAHYEGLDRRGMCEIHRRTFLTKYFAAK